nr:MAG TPA: hypothetical protein [Caudoviricetes sp.]
MIFTVPFLLLEMGRKWYAKAPHTSPSKTQKAVK